MVLTNQLIYFSKRQNHEDEQADEPNYFHEFEINLQKWLKFERSSWNEKLERTCP